jgi:putative spermidine/putrescine transport system ATP-binding protein
MSGASIIIRHLAKSFGEVIAVRDFNLDVRGGEFVSVLGQSGSGKSTVLRMIAGLELPSAGEILIDGKSSTNLPPEARDIGMVFQDYALFPHMSVRDNIAFPLRMRGVGRQEIGNRVAQIIDLVNLHGLEQRRPAQLSGGQQQRVAVARALVFDPKLLLLDEPLSALDKNLREHMKAELQALHKRVGITVIYVTHDQSEALALSDRIVVMHEGRIEGVDSPFDLYNFPSTRYIATFIGDANLLAGRITDIASDAIMVESAVGDWRVPRDRVRLAGNPSTGQAISIVVRPESILVDLPPGGDRQVLCVPCQVAQVLYSGSSTVYVLRSLRDGIELTARNERQSDRVIPPGTTLDASIMTNRSVVVGASEL